MNRRKYLLTKDVDGLGRSGEVVTAKAGFVRNYLLPQGFAVIADSNTLKMQARLQEERAKRAEVDKVASEKLAAELATVEITTVVKVDPEGKMYGSVSQAEIAKLLQEKGYEIERKNITLPQALKKLGKHTVPMRLKEGVMASFTLLIEPEEQPILSSVKSA